MEEELKGEREGGGVGRDGLREVGGRELMRRLGEAV